MFRNFLRTLICGAMATAAVLPSMASAHATIEELPSVMSAAHAPVNMDMLSKRPTYLENYVQEPGSRIPVGRQLGLARGYEVMPLSTFSVSSSEGTWMESTAYSAYETSGITATGEAVRHGIAAVDPNMIPLGSKLYVEGYGHALAADVGGAIQGNRIDLGFDSYQEALDWGRRDVKVHVLA